MQIGGLGYANNVAQTSGGKSPAQEGTNFNALLMAIQNSSSRKTLIVPTASKDAKLSLNDLKDLTAFLQKNQLTDLKDGLVLQDKLLTNPNADLLQMVKDYFGISDEKWKGILQSLSLSIKGKGEGVAISKEEKAQKSVKNEGNEDLSGIMNILSSFSALPPEKLSEMAGENFPVFMKAVKLFEMLSANRDIHSAKETTITTSMLAKVQQSLETLAAPQEPSTKMEFLQTTFTRLASELNTKVSKKVSNEGLIDEKTKEKNEISAPITNQQSFQVPMSKTEQLTLMLHSNGKPVNSENLIKQFEAILAKSQFTNGDGTQKLLIKLNPGNLGSLKVELTQKDDGIIARIVTTNGSAKDILDSHLNGLKQAFAAQNIQVDRIEVAQQFTQQERFGGREQHPNPQQQHHEHEENEQSKQQQSGDFTLSLNEALLNMEV